MNIPKITNIINIKTPQRISTPIKRGISKYITPPLLSSPENSAIGLAGMAVSGSYIVQRAIEDKTNNKIIQPLNLNKEISNKILSAKDVQGQHIFNHQNLQYLIETSDLKDLTFYSYIMKNIDSIDSFEKSETTERDILKIEHPVYVYKAHFYSEKGDNTITMNVKNREIDTNIIEKKNGITLYRKIENKDNEISEDFIKEKEVEKNGQISKKILSKYSVVYNKLWNKISRETYIDEHNLPKSFLEEINQKYSPSKKIVTNFSKEGVINSVTDNIYDNTDFSKPKVDMKSKFYKNGTIISAKGEKNYGNIFLQTKTYKNLKTGLMETIKMTPSDLTGVYNTVITDELGNVRVESYGRKNIDGSSIIEKNFESIDGTKTTYKRKSEKNGDFVKTFYQITSPEGDVLMTQDRIFHKISPNKIYSSVNGHEYKIEKTDDMYIVTDYLNGEQTGILFNRIFANEDSAKHPEVIEKLSADMLLDMYERGYKYQYINDDTQSMFSSYKEIIQTNEDLCSFAHEQGHSKDKKPYLEVLHMIKQHIWDNELEDKKYNITTNPIVVKEYEQERLNFIKLFSDVEQDYIKYFINKRDHVGGINGAAAEAIADANASLSTAEGDPSVSMRQYYLQKYFPRTIAAAAKLLNPNSNLDLTGITV